MLNAKIRGWANYYRHVVAKQTFGYVDYQIYLMLAQWIRRRHLNKSAAWRHKKYYRSQALRSWVFFAKIKDDKGNFRHLDLFRADSVKITRHIKIRNVAHPFDPQFADYFKQRNLRTKARKTTLLLDTTTGLKKA